MLTRLIGPLAAAAACYVVGCVGLAIHRGTRLERAARRFVRRVPRPDVRLLVVGDSSGVGVGASAPDRSIAGLLAEAHPTWSIGNLSRSGSRTVDAARVLARLARRTSAARASPLYDVILVHTGGNDALHFTTAASLKRSLRIVMRACHQLTFQTIIVTGGNFALAPGLPAPLRWWWGHRSRMVRRVFRRGTREHQATFVDLYRTASADPTTRDPDRYFAADGIHPADENYKLWLTAIEHRLAFGKERLAPGAASHRLIAAARCPS